MSRLMRDLEGAMRGSVATPVIIKTKPSFLHELKGLLRLNFDFWGQSIPRFNMFATILPNEIIDEVKQLNFVEAVYLDREIRIPEMRGAGIIFDPVEHVLIKFVALQPRRAITVPKPEWIPTSESRKLLEADQAEAEGYDGQGVKIGIIDTDSSSRYQAHPQLSGRVTGRSVIEEFSDKNGHGGHVSTTALGGPYTPRVLGLKLLGVAPKATGIGVKVLRGAAGMGNTSDVIKGIEYAAQQGVHVINLSLGGSPTHDPAEDPMFPVFQEIKDDIISCVAIGNDGPDGATTSAPGSFPNVLGVGAIDAHGVIANFSSRGPTPDGRTKPDVVAPGVNIFSGITLDTYLDHIGDYLGNAVSPLSGTSMATPHVTGLIALAVQLFRKELPEVKLTTDLVLDICRTYGQTKDNTNGYGRIRFSWFKQYVGENK